MRDGCALLRRTKKRFSKKHSLHRHDAVQGFGCSQQVFCRAKFAFAERSAAMKAPVVLLSDRTVLRSKMEGPRPDKFADVYTSALLASAMKPLNATSKFENHFAIRPVSFQVQLEAGGYFSVQKFSHLQPPQAGRAGTTSQVLNLIFYKSSFKTLVGLRPNPIFSTRMR